MPSEFELTTETRETGGDPVAVVRAVGDIDLANADVLAAELEAACEKGGGGVLLDLTGVEFMDSSGLRALLMACQKPDANMVTLVEPGSPVERLIELTEVKDRVRGFGGEAEALADLAAHDGHSEGEKA